MFRRPLIPAAVLLLSLAFASPRLQAAVTLDWSTASISGCLGLSAMEVDPTQPVRYYFKDEVQSGNEYIQIYDAVNGNAVQQWALSPGGGPTCEPARAWRVGDVDGSGYDDFVVETNQQSVGIFDLQVGPGTPILWFDSVAHDTTYVVLHIGLTPNSKSTKLTILETDPEPLGPVGVKQRLIQYDLGTSPLTAAPDAPGSFAGAELAQNRPNPFRAGTRIPYSASAPGEVELRILDVAGRLVRTMRDHAASGAGEFQWDGRDDGGRLLGNGPYFYQLVEHGHTQARKMMLVR